MRMAAIAVAACAALGFCPAAAHGSQAPAKPEAPSAAAASAATSPAAPAPPAPSAPGPPSTPAPADPYAGLPKVVAKAVKELEAECRAENGAPAWKPASIHAVVNVSPDGRPDYLVDTHAIACDGGFTPWVGSDGFRHILFVSTGPGRWTRAFDRGARGFEITVPKQGRRPQVVVFSHSGYCTRPNPERFMRCTQLYEWRRGRLRKIAEEWFEG